MSEGHADPDTEGGPEQCHLIGPVECGPPPVWAVTGWAGVATHEPDRVRFALTRVHAQELLRKDEGRAGANIPTPS